MSHDHNHNHGHHHHDKCCSHDAFEEHCHDDSCCTAHHHHNCSENEGEEFYAKLIEIADDAWMEVLKCKIKDHINKTSGSHLEELAKIVSDSNHCRWKHKMEARKGIGKFKEKVRDFFHRGE